MKSLSSFIKKLNKAIDNIESISTKAECNSKEIERISKKIESVSAVQQQINSVQKKNEKNNQEIYAELFAIKEGLIKTNASIAEEIARLAIPYHRENDNKIHGVETIDKLIREYSFLSVLDIGCGEGIYSEEFLRAGKEVTAIDYGKSGYFMKSEPNLETIIADFNTYEFDRQFDCVWCYHVLERQENAGLFLKKIFNILRPGGVLAISVPPAKHEIVGGHVSIWNAGLLLYNLILAGFDCSEACVGQYDYDISVICKKESVPKEVVQMLSQDNGDIKKLESYFPKGIIFKQNGTDISFDGEMFNVNWNRTSLNKFIREQKETRKPYKLKRWIEITTRIGCSNNCEYCPQELLISEYYKDDHNRKGQMDLEDFSKLLKHIPKWLDVCFTGFCEPFDNPDAFEMVKLSVVSGYKTHIYTTLRGLTKIQIQELKDLQIKTYVIHIPDKDNLMKIPVNDDYIDNLMLFNSYNLINTEYVCIGMPHKMIPEDIASRITSQKIMQSRAGNVEIKDNLKELSQHDNVGRIIDKNTPVICRKRHRYKGEDREMTHVECTVVLPDGSLYLCCQDFGLKHRLGNIYEKNYETIMHDKQMQTIEQSMKCENEESILCRNCELSEVYEK